MHHAPFTAGAEGGGGVRRESGAAEKRGKGYGGDGSSSGGSAAAKAKQLEVNDEKPTSELEQARWKATLDAGLWWTPLAACALASCILEERVGRFSQ